MRCIIIGAGTYGEVYLAYLKEVGVEIIGFLDDDIDLHGTVIKGIPILGGTDLLYSLKSTHQVKGVYCPIGNNITRAKFLFKAKQLGYEIPNYIHPTVTISPHVLIGEGVYILLNASIMPYVTIKDYVMISMNANIAHHSVLEEGTFISTGVNFGALITAHKYSYIGIGATIMTGLSHLGENCLVGAGSVVIKDVPEKAVVAGIPAKVLKYKQ